MATDTPFPTSSAETRADAQRDAGFLNEPVSDNANDVPRAFASVRRDYPQVPEVMQAAE